MPRRSARLRGMSPSELPMVWTLRLGFGILSKPSMLLTRDFMESSYRKKDRILVMKAAGTDSSKKGMPRSDQPQPKDCGLCW